MPRFVSAGVVNDEWRIVLGNPVESVGQRVVALGNCLCGWSVELVEQVLLLGVDDLQFVEPGAPVSPGPCWPPQNTRIEWKTAFVGSAFRDQQSLLFRR